MSSFIVENNVIDAVLAGVLWLHKHQQDPMALGARPNRDEVQALGRRLLALNAIAVDGPNTGMLRNYLYSALPFTPITSFKAACCLRYQCDQTRTRDMSLFRDLDKFLRALAFEIIAQTDEYKLTRWSDPRPGAEIVTFRANGGTADAATS